MDAFTAYELFVGQITTAEFVKPFDGDVEKAVNQLMTEKWWESDDNGTPAPDNLAELITQYVESNIE
jgi:hypothetical protein